MAIVNVPKLLREKLGEDGADALVELLNQANGEVKEDVVEVVASRFESRVDAMEEKFNGRVDALEEKFNRRVDAMEEKFNSRVDALEEKFNGRVDALEERFERRLAEEGGKLRAEFGALRGEFVALEERFDKKLAQIEARLVRWTFVFWVGLLSSQLAILFAFFK